MQELIKQGMKQKLEKSCFRYKENTWHVEYIYLLQPAKYLIIVVNVLQKNIRLQRQQNYGVWNDWYQKTLYCLCGNV